MRKLLMPILMSWAINQMLNKQTRTVGGAQPFNPFAMFGQKQAFNAPMGEQSELLERFKVATHAFLQAWRSHGTISGKSR